MAIVRTSPRAIICRGDKYLVVRYQDASGDWCAFPGGGQLNGEDLYQALKREIHEEISVIPQIGALRFVRECIAARDNNRRLPAEFHQLELFFECMISAEPVTGILPDSTQAGIEWLTIDQLRERQFFPSAILEHLETSDGCIYLGAC